MLLLKARAKRYITDHGKHAQNWVDYENQPSCQMAHLFNHSGAPWLSQYWVREVLDNYYGTDPVNGYHGDEDQGQMGAWYVMSAMGLFQMDGGASADPVYELSGPLFEKITIQLDQDYYEGKEFIIEASAISEGIKRDARFDGALYPLRWAELRSFYPDTVTVRPRFDSDQITIILE